MNPLLGKVLDHLIVARAILGAIEGEDKQAQDIQDLDEIIRHCNNKFYGMKKNDKSPK